MNPIYKILRNYLNRTRFLDIKEITDLYEYSFNSCCGPDTETTIDYVTNSGAVGQITLPENLASLTYSVEERDAHDQS